MTCPPISQPVLLQSWRALFGRYKWTNAFVLCDDSITVGHMVSVCRNLLRPNVLPGITLSSAKFNTDVSWVDYDFLLDYATKSARGIVHSYSETTNKWRLEFFIKSISGTNYFPLLVGSDPVDDENANCEGIYGKSNGLYMLNALSFIILFTRHDCNADSRQSKKYDFRRICKWIDEIQIDMLAPGALQSVKDDPLIIQMNFFFKLILSSGKNFRDRAKPDKYVNE